VVVLLEINTANFVNLNNIILETFNFSWGFIFMPHPVHFMLGKYYPHFAFALPWASRRQHINQDLDPFSRLCTLQPCGQMHLMQRNRI